jgi:DNA-binding transcriptional LysR family regulator
MDRIQGMKVFVGVAQQGGFASAARELRISAAQVTKHVSALESQLGTRLFDRTTRRVALTEAGRVYLERCIECLHALEDADASVGELSKKPKGVLRVTAPIDFGDHILPVITQVMNAYPDVVVDLRLSNRVVDLVEEGIDVAVRAAPSLDGRYVARQIARMRLSIYGSPEYFRRYGKPRTPEELASHRTIVFTEPKPMDELVFRRGRREVRVKLNGVLMTNSGAAITAAAERSVGLATAPSFLARAGVDAGMLEPILLDWTLMEYRLFAVYPHRRFLSPKVRVFIEALRDAFGDGQSDPWWPHNMAGSALRDSAKERPSRKARPRRSGKTKIARSAST